LRKITVAAAMLLLSMPAGVADDFYKGKVIRIIVGFGPGGGYDLYARLLAQYLGKHIPGQPSVVVENMNGAGSVKAANYVYGMAQKDGTVIATVDQIAPMYQMLGGEGAQFNPGDIQWLGSMAFSNGLLYTWHTSDIKSIEDAKKREVIMGGTAVTADSYIYPTVVNGLLGTKFKVVLGYPDANSSNLAIERGEVTGGGGNSWLSLLGSRRAWIDDKKINFILQVGVEKEPELASVPLFSDLVKDPDGRQIADLISFQSAIGYASWVAPGVPADRVALLRAAFDETMKDPAMLADAAKRRIVMRPQGGAQIGVQVKRISNTSQTVLDRAAKLLDWSK
jgi:tripartite-type tricarboxylate transporter receptor subunit TctC